MIAMSLKCDVHANDFSNYNCEVSRETETTKLWKIAKDLDHKLDALDMVVPCVAVAEAEDFLLVYQHEATDRLILLKGYVLKVE